MSISKETGILKRKHTPCRRNSRIATSASVGTASTITSSSDAIGKADSRYSNCSTKMILHYCNYGRYLSIGTNVYGPEICSNTFVVGQDYFACFANRFACSAHALILVKQGTDFRLGYIAFNNNEKDGDGCVVLNSSRLHDTEFGLLKTDICMSKSRLCSFLTKFSD